MLIDFRQKGREGERERNINVREKHGSAASSSAPGRDQTHNLGLCPERESNLLPFGSQD